MLQAYGGGLGRRAGGTAGGELSVSTVTQQRTPGRIGRTYSHRQDSRQVGDNKTKLNESMCCCFNTVVKTHYALSHGSRLHCTSNFTSASFNACSFASQHSLSSTGARYSPQLVLGNQIVSISNSKSISNSESNKNNCLFLFAVPQPPPHRPCPACWSQQPLVPKPRRAPARQTRIETARASMGSPKGPWSTAR
eukprot:COSAG06_NODE_19926_length_817_cov_1.505571_1_plen_194_part_00